MTDHSPSPDAVQEFIQRWETSGAAERANYQIFLTELCDVLSVPRPEPTRQDESENAYVFEVTWFYEDEIYLYESVPGSILVKPGAETVRFDLRDLYGEDNNFEVVSSGKGGSYAFSTDYFGGGEFPRPLKRFDAQDETIFLSRGQQGKGLLSPPSLGGCREMKTVSYGNNYIYLFPLG